MSLPNIKRNCSYKHISISKIVGNTTLSKSFNLLIPVIRTVPRKWQVKWIPSRRNMTAGNNSGSYEKFKLLDKELAFTFPDNLWQADAVTSRTFCKRTSYPSFCMTRAYFLSLFKPWLKLSQGPLQFIFPLENIKQFPSDFPILVNYTRKGPRVVTYIN